MGQYTVWQALPGVPQVIIQIVLLLIDFGMYGYLDDENDSRTKALKRVGALAQKQDERIAYAASMTATTLLGRFLPLFLDGLYLYF